MFTELTRNKLILGNVCQPEVKVSTGSEAFRFLICLETAKFVLLWVFTPKDMIF